MLEIPMFFSIKLIKLKLVRIIGVEGFTNKGSTKKKYLLIKNLSNMHALNIARDCYVNPFILLRVHERRHPYRSPSPSRCTRTPTRVGICFVVVSRFPLMTAGRQPRRADATRDDLA